MTSLAREELRSFHEFIVRKIEEDGPDELSPEEVLDLWRSENPAPEERAADMEAIRQSLEDVEAGRFRPARDVLAQLREQYQTPDVS